MVREFVRRAPPTSPLLACYGGGFAEQSAGFAPAASLPCLADLARPERLGGLRCALHPSERIVVSGFAVVELWAAHQHQDSLQVEAALASLAIERTAAALVLRHNLEGAVVPMAPTTATWCAALGAGETLADAHARALGDDPNFDLVPALGLILRYGPVAAIAEARGG